MTQLLTLILKSRTIARELTSSLTELQARMNETKMAARPSPALATDAICMHTGAEDC
jgi:hypothetical protein